MSQLGKAAQAKPRLLLRCRDRWLDLSTPRVMGVLNVTPDSFSDGGQFFDCRRALSQAEQMLVNGADLIDVGGESTRPGAAPVPAEQEITRVVPVVKALVQMGAIVSVDTSKAEVMRAALDEGAHLINDVYALRRPGALEVLASSEAAVCLMHMQGEPVSMQTAPEYTDVVLDVVAFLQTRISACTAHGLPMARILVDPGFGFGKTPAHNLRLLRELPQLGALGVPILAGLSRKSLLGVLTGRSVEQRLAGSLALAYAALEGGARIIRAHDVAETTDVLKVWSSLQKSGETGRS
ncbi:MAG: dihydropteroate synthase [Steroidobacteraceae bacterium]